MLDFGITLKPDAHHERIVALTQQAEEAGFAYGWLFDSHVLWQEPYPLLTPGRSGRFGSATPIQSAEASTAAAASPGVSNAVSVRETEGRSR